jgi:hypothetical protein
MMDSRIKSKKMNHESAYLVSPSEGLPGMDSDEPKRSPIRRRSKLPNDDFDPNNKRNNKKKRHRQKNGREHDF